jgi:hypothetical protein
VALKDPGREIGNGAGVLLAVTTTPPRWTHLHLLETGALS